MIRPIFSSAKPLQSGALSRVKKPNRSRSDEKKQSFYASLFHAAQSADEDDDAQPEEDAALLSGADAPLQKPESEKLEKRREQDRKDLDEAEMTDLGRKIDFKA